MLHPVHDPDGERPDPPPGLPQIPSGRCVLADNVVVAAQDDMGRGGYRVVEFHEPSPSTAAGARSRFGFFSRWAMRDSSSAMRVSRLFMVPHSGSGRRRTVSSPGSAKATTWPGTPTTVAFGGTLVTTTEPAPILAFSPTVTSPITFAPAPTTTLRPSVGCRLARRVLVPPSESDR